MPCNIGTNWEAATKSHRKNIKAPKNKLPQRGPRKIRKHFDRYFEKQTTDKDGIVAQEPTPMYTFLKKVENTSVPLEADEVKSGKSSSNEVKTKSKGILPVILMSRA